ncbi:tubulin-like doman-containing protein [Thermosynechococcus sp. M55_K2018_012]|uniref:tubulin-like doman-containing protein n=1 Tax=Thermosynechococcus sp. M55_K2018_012 TaxID=2747809 RepID=UPI0019E2B7E4|nr:tubulin-like doman-containing protein [Thermosynechococcus sp. M55_K2018_012]HIK48926.1 SHOCT domain-containing protein [Thermosynechococcus sp. M55_K2018_012]
MPAQVEEKSIVPTVVVGVGGTGIEVLSRVRRLVEETYGSLKQFPVISFLAIDTDRDYKVSNPLAAGSPLKDNEKHWASVSGKNVQQIIQNLDNYPWIASWFPKELERNITALEAGAGQIRACGRFAFFCNYHAIQQKFQAASDRVKGHESFMQSRYGLKVNNSSLNVFITGSLSGGTGSGMLIDLGYCVRHWLKGQSSPLVTGIVPMPNAFAAISVGDRVLANGYAALMELSYFADYRTEYVAQFSSSLSDEVRYNCPPFDFTYLVGTKNGESEFRLDEIREMIAQNIFLDLTSDFAPHKRSIRDNIKAAWASQDAGGRSYPKSFMAFGLSSVEIPIAQIRASLTYRLCQDFIDWWLNESVQLPPQLLEVTESLLKPMNLLDMDLVLALAAAGDRPYMQEISRWVNDLRNQISRENRLECTQQGVGGIIGAERGKILQFVPWLSEQVDNYRAAHLRELSPDERLHGDFLQRMYDNRNQIIQQARQSLEEEFYRIVEDRNRGLKFANAFLRQIRQIFISQQEKYDREIQQTWQPNITNRQRQYENALQDINHFSTLFGISKQAKMEEFCQQALEGIEGSFNATIQAKARFLAKEVMDKLEEWLQGMEARLAKLNQRLLNLRDGFKAMADSQADSADALRINGVKLYDRQELNSLYQDLVERYAGANTGVASTFTIGLNQLCTTTATTVLQEASPLWKQTRAANEVMRLLDLAQLAEVQESDLREIIQETVRRTVQNAPEESRLVRDLTACDRLLQFYRNDEAEILNALRMAYQKSKPLLLLSQAVISGRDAGFTPSVNTNIAIVGGENTADLAAKKLIPLLKNLVKPSGQSITSDDIKPLGDRERHRIVFVQEMGGFSLRCIEGMPELRQSYQDWRGQMITAKRARLRGENRDLPIPVHLQKDPPFWDVFPENPQILKLVVTARALGVLKQAENRATREATIRYTRHTTVGLEDVDIAGNWEEVTQVLEVLACRPDLEEIQRQVTVILKAAATPEEKQALYEHLLNYLKRREEELHKAGGRDSLEYKREAAILQEVIQTYQLAQGTPAPRPTPTSPAPEPSPSQPEPTPETRTSANSPSLEQLQQLVAMYQQGLLSEAEFQAAKKKLLGL